MDSKRVTSRAAEARNSRRGKDCPDAGLVVGYTCLNDPLSSNAMGLSLLTTLFLAAGCPSPCERRFGPPEDTAPVPAGGATEPKIRLTVPWLAAQLVPNPALALGSSGAHLRLSWQLSPVLYSLFMDPRLSPWRFFIAEPIVRHAGSVELVLSPEYVSAPGRLAERWGYRALVRSTFGLIQRGEYLSMSLGAGYLSLREGESVEYEAGIYALFGNVGLTLQFAPALEDVVWTFTLRTRFF